MEVAHKYCPHVNKLKQTSINKSNIIISKINMG